MGTEGVTGNSLLELLVAIKPDFIPSLRFKLSVERFHVETYQLAKRNGLPLSYLKHAISLDKSKEALALYHKHMEHLDKVLETVSNICELFSRSTRDDVKFIIVKTLRPYLEDTYDVDVLILGDLEMFKRALNILIRNKYQINYTNPYGPYNINLIAPNGVDVDLYFDLSASYLIYLHKRYLENHITETTLPNNVRCYVLKPYAELLLLALHDVIKEEVKLGTIFTSLHIMHNMKNEDFHKLASLCSNTFSTVFLFKFISLLYTFVKTYYNYVEPQLIKLLHILGLEEKLQIFPQVFEETPPYRIKLPHIFDAFIAKMHDAIFNASVAVQLIHVFKYMFSSEKREKNKLLIDYIVKRL